MARHGRNAPCPCGSGQKYKKCCLRRDLPLPGSYSAEDRQLALQQLGQLLEGPGFDAIEDEALDLFWRGVPDDEASSSDRQLAAMSDAAYDGWMFFDFELKPGRRPVDLLLADETSLTPGARAYLRAARGTAMRLYEIADVRPGESLLLREVLGAGEVQVRERSASQTARRWDLLAARVVPRGASGHPEIDGGCFPFPRQRRVELVAHIQAEREAWEQMMPDLDALDFEKGALPPLFHQLWRIGAPPPRLVNYDGDPVVMTRVLFDVRDETRLVQALDGSRALSRVEQADELRWGLSAKGKQRREPVVRGWYVLRGRRLDIETNSVERGAAMRRRLERLAGDAVSYRTTVVEDVQQAAERLEAGPPPRPDDDAPAELLQAMADVAEQHLADHYERWLDEPVPMLDDRTPREAKAIPTLRPRLVDMLKDLERHYEQALSAGAPAFDPTWMWEELGLDTAPDAPRRRGSHPPALGHESLERHHPGLLEVTRTVAARVRKAASEHAFERVIEPDELEADLGFRRIAQAGESGLLEAARLACNFELHLRKAFWVDEGLAWMLGATRLDVTGEALRMPFRSFALVFTDRYALGLAERLLSRQPDARQRGRILRVLTAYVTESPMDGEARLLRVSLTFDALDGTRPDLLVRELVVRPDARLDAILEGRLPESERSALEPLHAGAPLERLLDLVVHSVLYATSASAPPPEERASPSRRRPGAPPLLDVSSESVYFLPGSIDIQALREVRRLRRGTTEAQLTRRCMVRGHWRRADRRWKDQSPRWIQPHWRGPDAAAIVERSYRLRP